MDRSRSNPTDLRAQERERDQRALTAKVAHDADLLDVKWLMSDANGRRFMWRLLDRAGVFRTSFTGNSETFFREGMRNMGLMYLNQITEICPEMYAVMVNEAADQRKASNAT